MASEPLPSAAGKIRSEKPYAAFSGAIVPERNLLTRELVSGFTAHFWGQAQGSARSLDGLVSCSPGDPSPMPLAAPSGLSRAQLLVATHAVTVPCFPSYCCDQGGLVLDRVLLKGGGDHWWAALTGRAKVQNWLAGYQESSLVQQLKNPGNYMLSTSVKASFPNSSTTLRCKADLDGEACSSGNGGGGGGGSGGGAAAKPPLASATVQLCQKLKASEMHLDVAVNKAVVSGAPSKYGTVPVNVTMDIGTAAGSAPAVLYRAGLHHSMEYVSAAAGAGEESSSGASGTATQLRPSVSLRSAVAVQGERTLWSKAGPRRSPATRSSSAMGSADPKPSEPAAPAAPVKAGAGAGSGKGRAPPSAAAEKGESKDGCPVPARTPAMAEAGPGAQAPGAASDKERKAGLGAAGSLGELLDPEQVKAKLHEGTDSLQRLRKDVQEMTSWVRSGSLAQQLGQGARRWSAGAGAGVAGRDRGKGGKALLLKGPKSAALAPPNLKVGGLLGMTLRAPLSRYQSGWPGKQQQQQRRQEQGQQEPQGAADEADGTDARLGRLDWLQRQLRGSFWSPELRTFASGAAVLQLGSMQRGFLDFTRVLVKTDLGLVGADGPSVLGEARAGGQGAGPSAYLRAMDGCTPWHALTVSCSQQLVGPVRLCADWRFALSPSASSAPAEVDASPERSHGSVRSRILGLPAHVRSIRPLLVDSCVGLDVSVPNTSGLVRLVAWYAPSRKEGMVDVRLF